MKLQKNIMKIFKGQRIKNNANNEIHPSLYFRYLIKKDLLIKIQEIKYRL